MQRTVRASRRHRHASMVARSPVRIRIASDKGSEKKGPRQRVGDLRAWHRPQAPATSTKTEVAWSGSVSSPIAALRRPQVITGSVNMAPKRARRTAASPASASPNQLPARSTRSERMLPGPPRPRGRQATSPAPYHPSPNARPARARSSPARSGARRRAVARADACRARYRGSTPACSRRSPQSTPQRSQLRPGDRVRPTCRTDIVDPRSARGCARRTDRRARACRCVGSPRVGGRDRC